MRLSKSKILSFRQCEKRLWLEVHRPDLRQDSPQSLARMKQGDEVGALARTLYDPAGVGTLLDVAQGIGRLLDQTTHLLTERRPIFEAGFTTDRMLVLVDILMPVGRTQWHAVEVKSSTSVKDYQQTDVAVQALTLREAGVDLAGIAVAHIDSDWTYKGDGRFEGLLREVDMTERTEAMATDVRGWIATASEVAAASVAPAIRMGAQCREPFDCPFMAFCGAEEPLLQHPAAWLPHVRNITVREAIRSRRWREMSEVPDALLNPQQTRVKSATIRGQTFFDRAAARQELARYPAPVGFLDFEAAQFAIPRWGGTRPYQQVPFQFSYHLLRPDGEVAHTPFLDLTGDDPSRAFAEALVDTATAPTIFAYNATFERQRIAELADRFPDLAGPLRTVQVRIVDLLPIVRDTYYHPAQQGSWSLKAVLPTIAPELDYKTLDGVQAGDDAVAAYTEAISSRTGPERNAEIRRQLEAYCARDTFALVAIYRFLTGA